MGQAGIGSDGWTYTQRSVKGSECSLVDETNMTPDEADSGDNSGGDNPDQNGDTNPDGSVSPIVFDLDKDGFQFSGLDDPVSFDLDGDGSPEVAAWLARFSDDAFLALDRNLNGAIDDGRELFGNFTAQPDSSDPNGYLALAVFDSARHGGNSDGWITNDDGVYASLRLWKDENRDGISQPWELTSLAWEGIAAINLDFRVSAKRDRHGNYLRWWSRVYRANGSFFRSVDVLFLVTQE